jgi:hypothetical protein
MDKIKIVLLKCCSSDNFIEPFYMNRLFDNEELTFYDILFTLIEDKIMNNKNCKNKVYKIFHDDDIIYQSSRYQFYNYNKYNYKIDKSINIIYLHIYIHNNLILDIIDECKQVLKSYINLKNYYTTYDSDCVNRYYHRFYNEEREYTSKKSLCHFVKSYCYKIKKDGINFTMKIKLNNNQVVINDNDYKLETTLYKICLDFHSYSKKVYIEFYNKDNEILQLVYSYDRYIDIDFFEFYKWVEFSYKSDNEKLLMYLNIFDIIFDKIEILDISLTED